MGLRFFADHCIPNLAIRALTDEDHEVLRLKHHIPIESSDQAVIATGYYEQRENTPGGKSFSVSEAARLFGRKLPRSPGRAGQERHIT